MTAEQRWRAVTIPAGGLALNADLIVPAGAGAVVVFAHGTGSGRRSPRNRRVASVLAEAGLGALLMDLLTQGEEARDRAGANLRFDVEMLGERTVAAVDWLASEATTVGLPVGAFGASTGAAAALIAAAERPERVLAVVSRGGRPDLATGALDRVRAPTLLIVGALDTAVIEMNREAMAALPAETRLELVDGASHLFEEPGALDRVAALARDWLVAHLSPPA